MASAASPTVAARTPASEISPYRWIIVIGLITASIMEVLDTTIVNVALPQMAGNLGATTQEIGWVSTGYILANVVVLPMTAFLVGRFGRKNYLAFSIILFIVSSFFCGTSHALLELVIWRILQGAGGAALLSTAQATLRQIFPPEQQGLVQSVFVMGIIVAPTLGPTLGGWITDHYTWNWCFFINIPIGLVSLFLVTQFLHDPAGMRRNATVDYLGILLLAVGLGSLQYVLEEGQSQDWFADPTILKLAILSAVTLSAMLWWELSPRNEHPIVDFRVLKNPALTSAIVLFVTLGFGLYGGVYLFPIFAQSILRFTPTETGLVLLPGGLATAASALICGKLLGGKKPLVDPRVPIFVGLVIFMISMWDLGHLTILSGEPDTRVSLIVRGFGLGFLFTPINQVAYASLRPNEVQQASGLINLARQLGGSFGIAILGTYVQAHAAFHRANLVTHIYPGNPAVDSRMQAITSGLVAKGMPLEQAKQGALAVMDQTVQRQSMTMSFNDGFLLILVIFMFATPAVLMLKKPTGGRAAPADAH
ncbi:DHA2 family efflux MFS transporter permease subunit [Fimbriimonas ginsengisoli]|uniref:Inner membrane component of tripartite multidrug resistance system n=1 Tax=Fimbriimonas ginsengisoli Gsoil 348 TaxID=661478 RepID=A0A068NPX7_FIMGI|nr:DHA2 family efflux MFS transporter permease subunit [Fimbriimonas ginsengisoli]AIE84820.1 Inner membrane component of tripartite multidrug resistance system [Fimbriimonas ginsengisoli Gsoil 348]